MITKNDLKVFSSLLQKKFRQKEQKFIAEGKKIVSEAIDSGYFCHLLVATNDFVENENLYVNKLRQKGFDIITVKNHEFEKLSDTVTPQGIAGIFRLPLTTENNADNIDSKLVVYLENISDPGNMGTIIRNCDWFGVTDIFIHNCADVYSPKAIRSSMGSVFHLNFYYDNDYSALSGELKRKGYKILVADIPGEDISEFRVPEKTAVVLSNEANGPGEKVLSLADARIMIKGKGKAESLNVANASAIILYALSR
jgi:TrmH family RNA methyltransferase